MPVSQAEAVVASQAEVTLHNLANKQDIENLLAETKKNIHILRAKLSRDLADGLHRQNRFMLTALMGFALLIIAFIQVRLLVCPPALYVKAAQARAIRPMASSRTAVPVA